MIDNIIPEKKISETNVLFENSANTSEVILLSIFTSSKLE